MKPFFCIKSLNNLNPEFMEDSSLIKKFLIIFNEFLSIYSDKKVQMTDSIILDLTDALYYHKHVVYNIKSKTDERCHQFKNSNEAKLLLHEFEVQLTNFVNEINANNISESKNNFFLKTNGNWNGEITCNQNSNEKKFLNKFSYRLCKNFVIKKFDGKDRNNISIVKNQLLINMKVYKEVMEVPLLFAVADETNIDVETKEPRYVNVCETSPTTLTEDSVWEEFYWKSLLTVSISLNKETKVYTDYVNNYADGVCFSNEGIATKKESGLKKTSGSRENGDLRKNKFSHERQSNKNSATFSLKTDTNTEAIIKRCPDNDGVLSKCFIVWIKESATVYTGKISTYNKLIQANTSTFI